VLLAYAVTRVASSLERQLVEGRHVVVIVDDVARPLGLKRLEAYVKSLLRLVEYDLAELHPASVLVVASTGEGLGYGAIPRGFRYGFSGACPAALSASSPQASGPRIRVLSRRRGGLLGATSGPNTDMLQSTCGTSMLG